MCLQTLKRSVACCFCLSTPIPTLEPSCPPFKSESLLASLPADITASKVQPGVGHKIKAPVRPLRGPWDEYSPVGLGRGNQEHKKQEARSIQDDETRWSSGTYAVHCRRWGFPGRVARCRPSADLFVVPGISTPWWFVHWVRKLTAQTSRHELGEWSSTSGWHLHSEPEAGTSESTRSEVCLHVGHLEAAK